MSWAPADSSVLLVDDDPLFAKLFDRQIDRSGLGVQVVHAATVREAEHELDEHRFDLALVDERLPDGSGTSLAGRVAGLSDCPPVIVITGGDDRQLWHRAAAAEAIALVPKDVVATGRVAEVLEFGFCAGAERRVAELTAEAGTVLRDGVDEALGTVLDRLVARLGLTAAMVQVFDDEDVLVLSGQSGPPTDGGHVVARAWRDLRIELRLVASTRRWNRVDAMLRVWCDVVLRQVELDRGASPT